MRFFPLYMDAEGNTGGLFFCNPRGEFATLTIVPGCFSPSEKKLECRGIEISIARRRGVRSFVETARRLMTGIVSFIAASDGWGWGSRINAVRDVKGQCRATASP